MADLSGLLKTIKAFVPKPLLRIVPESVHDYAKAVLAPHTRSYSQCGEDLVVASYFALRPRSSGFYVDIGAHSPIKFSNTYYFYKRGWRGINIDATPGSMRVFERVRPRDINLEVAISESEEDLTFFVFGSEGLVNTASHRHAEYWSERLGETPRQVRIKARPLREVLAEHLAPFSKIDLMSVDVEGLDASVLRSNDWARYRPELLLVESFARDLEEVRSTEVSQILNREGYRIFAWVPWTIFFLQEN